VDDVSIVVQGCEGEKKKRGKNHRDKGPAIGIHQVLVIILALFQERVSPSNTLKQKSLGALLFPHTIPINMRIKISLYIFIQHFHLLCRRRVCTYFHGLFRIFRQHHINLTPYLLLLLKFTFNLPFSTLLFFPR